LWSNTGIPAIAPQGEGYTMSETAVNELKRRYKEIYVLYDTDEAGKADSLKLAEQTGFKRLQLPDFQGGKDVSDLYKTVGKNQFINIISTLF
jgi:DNA primase